MTQVVVIGLVLTLLAHDALLGAPGAVRLPPAEIFAMTLLPQAAIAGFVHAWVWRCGRRIDRTGSGVYVASAEAAVMLSRWGALAVHATATLALGWLDLVRNAMGDWVLVDEAVATLPPLFTLTAGWASYAQIDSRLRQAAFFGALERGEPLYPTRTTWQYVSDQVRGQALFLLIPMGMALGWIEALNVLFSRFEARLPFSPGSTFGGAIFLALQLAGTLGVFLIAPVIIRRVWSATRMGPGPLRDRLEGLCAAQGVTHRGLLVWHTHGTMLNGAVLGLIGPLRYILLTDALLDHLTDEQVEAVLAHEMGHVRRRHMPWLVAGMAASLTLGAAVVGLGQDALVRWAADAGLMTDRVATITAPVMSIFGLGAALAAGLLGIGLISKRFEWQADAFAAQRLSGAGRNTDNAGLTITSGAAEAMIGALRAVADRNFIPISRRSWRHGSIAERIRRLRSIVGMPVGALPIDRQVRVVKRVILVALVSLIAWAILGAALADKGMS